MVMDSPPVLMLDSKDLQDILQANKIDEQTILICRDYFERLHMLCQAGQRLCLSISPDNPKHRPEKYFSSELSALLGTSVYLSSDQRKRLYSSLITALGENSWHDNIALIDEKSYLH